MVRRPFHDPFFYKFSGSRGKEAAGIGIAGGWDRACLRNSLTDNELEFSVIGLGDAQHGDRAFLDLKLHGGTVTRLAVIFF